MKRRSHRLIVLLVLIDAACLPSVVSAEELVKIVAGPMFTPVSEHSICVWVQTNRDVPLELEAATETLVARHGPLPTSVKLRMKTECREANISTVTLEVYDYTSYRFLVRTDDPTNRVLTEKVVVRTPPKPGKSGSYTLAFGSCSHQERFGERQPIWDVAVKQKPDAFLFIGDNIYLPNRTNEFPVTREEVFKLYHDTYDRQRRMADLQPLLRSTMNYAIWDDHDFGPNNSDRTWQWKDVALEAMKLYFPNNYGLPDAPGCFYKFSWGDIDVFMLDDRTYRDLNNDPERKTFLGAKQLAWLKARLTDSKATFKLVVCGNQMLSDTHPHESWGVQFRPERDAFLEWLWDRKLTGVIFLAGDRHFAELVRKKDPKGRGDDLWELTSSPLANQHYQDGPSFANPERVAAYSDGVNVGVLKFDTTARPPQVELIILDVDGKPVIRQRVTTRHVR